MGGNYPPLSKRKMQIKYNPGKNRGVKRFSLDGEIITSHWQEASDRVQLHPDLDRLIESEVISAKRTGTSEPLEVETTPAKKGRRGKPTPEILPEIELQ